jgi:hypothetical protein
MGSGAEHFLGVKKLAGVGILGGGGASALALPLPLDFVTREATNVSSSAETLALPLPLGILTFLEVSAGDREGEATTGDGSLVVAVVILVEDLGVLTFLGVTGVLETVGDSTLVVAAEDFEWEAKGETLEAGLTDLEGRGLTGRGVERAVFLGVMVTGERSTEGEVGVELLASAEVETLEGEANDAGR